MGVGPLGPAFSWQALVILADAEDMKATDSAPCATRWPKLDFRMYSASTWFGEKSPDNPAKAYTSLSETVFVKEVLSPTATGTFDITISAQMVKWAGFITRGLATMGAKPMRSSTSL